MNFWNISSKPNKEEEAFKNGWQVGFSAGMLKSWDLLIPVMSENMDRLKQKLKDDAISEAISRLENRSASNKK